MSRKPSFANLRDRTPPASAVVAQTTNTGPTPVGQVQNNRIGGQGAATGPASRQGRKQIAGFFSPEMSFAMHTLARRQGRSLQALMAEAFNDVLRKHGESPIGD
ncbi:ribbon-helix-helix domain-containing protein [Sphingomonas faeni]|uniref:ribbon-helix-helix domain-containing protein n=1 Tax=Sphingomonas faeni TaxID=185950 RepID=UPI0024138BE2|nr:ribbon-helix-helix domain-containing protein [Sphingomonas faeni]